MFFGSFGESRVFIDSWPSVLFTQKIIDCNYELILADTCNIGKKQLRVFASKKLRTKPGTSWFDKKTTNYNMQIRFLPDSVRGPGS